MLMERVAEIIRGWPQDGALDTVEQIATGATLVAGDWVERTAGGAVDKTSATATAKAGLVVQGNGDSASAVASGNKAVVVWSNFIVRVSNYTAGSYAPGADVTVKAGKLAVANGTTDPVIGTVQLVNVASSSQTASIVVLVK